MVSRRWKILVLVLILVLLIALNPGRQVALEAQDGDRACEQANGGHSEFGSG